MNYIGNAIKFTKKGKIDVIVDYDRDGVSPGLGLIKLEVVDTGVGISKQDQEKLFNPFTMLDANKSLNPNGTGMGLNICKRIVMHLGGKVWLQSVVNHGSTFGFSLACE